ncbi:ATP-binding protein [Dictyobacter vulcani]|nr:ATP-binding protein [Dictyobacter vulcani]
MFEKHYLPWLFSFPHMPRALWLTICAMSTPICMITYMLTFNSIHCGSLLILTMFLWTWAFSQKGVYICLLSCLAVLGIYILCHLNMLSSPPTLLISILLNLTVMLAIGQGMVFFKAKCVITDTPHGEQEHQRKAVGEQLRQFEQIKTQFVININHELRTPLTATYSYFELLKMLFESHGYLEYKAHGVFLKDALRYCEDLRAIVNNILNTMDIDNNQSALINEECSIAQVVLETCDNIAALQQEQYRVHLQLSSYLLVRANKQYLRHILHQLLTNAVRYTPSGTPIVLRAEADPDEPQTICISIQDAGPGIPPDEQVHIFEQFARLPRDVAGTVRGTGQGLYICQRLVERMHGRIWVESSGIAGEGSCFRFTLPRIVPMHANNFTTQPTQAHSVGRR